MCRSSRGSATRNGYWLESSVRSMQTIAEGHGGWSRDSIERAAQARRRHAPSHHDWFPAQCTVADDRRAVVGTDVRQRRMLPAGWIQPVEEQAHRLLRLQHRTEIAGKQFAALIPSGEGGSLGRTGPLPGRRWGVDCSGDADSPRKSCYTFCRLRCASDAAPRDSRETLPTGRVVMA